MKAKIKGTSVSIRFLPHERSKLDKAAMARGMRLGTFVRQAALLLAQGDEIRASQMRMEHV
jgi:uncharacterized protein (DUF1778 family)